MMRTAILIVALTAGFSGPAVGNGGGHLWGSSWQVGTIDALDIAPADGVTIDFTDGRIAGRSGCNRYTGPVILRADRIAPGPIVATRMACPGRPERIEAAFLAALDQVTHWRMDPDGALELTSDGAVLIRATAAP